MSGKNFECMGRSGAPQASRTVDASAAELEALLADAPPDIARQIEESLDDLRHDRIEDTGAFLRRMRAKIADARATARDDKGQSR
jgi:hypothetical protein